MKTKTTTFLQRPNWGKFKLAFIMCMVFMLNSINIHAQYTKLKITINSASNLHFQEVEWMVGTTAYPTIDMASNNDGGYVASSDKAGSNAWRAFDGTTDKIYVGDNTPYSVTLELPSGITPGSVRVQKPSWSGLSDFTCEGYNGSSWDVLAHVQNPDNWGGFAEFDLSTSPPPSGDASKVAAMNLHWAKDWLPPIFADVYVTAREWKNLANDGSVNLDTDGWPTEDAGVVMWHGYGHKSGTYRLSFNGQADISYEWASNLTIQNVSYNSSTNTTTADLVFSARSNALRLKFSNTSGGIQNVKLMRPIANGSSTYHSPDEVMDREMKAIVSKFDVIRYMDPSNTNSNPETTWSDRRKPGDGYINRVKYNPYSYSDKPTSIPWEYIIAISNETNTSPWICIPAMVDNDYMNKVAQMFRYGSNGTNPYTSSQSNPVWEPLQGDLELYVEWSNEVWNSGSAFKQHHYNYETAIDEVEGNLNHPLNYDDLVTSVSDVESKGYDFAKRRVSWKSAELSKIFRSVFGDGQMMSRVRPLFLWQVSRDGINSWGLSGLTFVDAYYRQAENHDVDYYFWGGGPAGYYSPDDDATIDNVWTSNDMDHNYWGERSPEYDGRLCAAFGLKFVYYEGGPGFGDALGGSGSTPVGEEAWNDSRIYDEMDEHHTMYNQKGGDLFCYYVLHHDFRWTFLHEGTMNDDTYKMQYMEDMQSQDKANTNVGYNVPVSLNGGQFEVCKTGWWLGNSGQQNPDGGRNLPNGEWLGYRLHSSSDATYNITVDYKTSATSELEIVAGGDLLASTSVPNTGNALQSTSAYSFSMPANRLYGIRVRTVGSGDIFIDKIHITDGGGGGTNEIQSVNVPTDVTAGNGYAVSVDYESTGTYDIAMRIEDASDGYKSYGEFRQTVNAGSGTVNGTLNVDAGAPAHSNYQIQTVITEVGGWWSQKLDNLNTSNVTVSSGGGNPPSVSFDTPADDASFDEPANVYVKVNASDEDGIDYVKLYVNGEFVRQENVSPYEWGASGQNDPLLENMAAGSYTLRTVATDNAGETAEASINISVDGSGETDEIQSVDVPTDVTAGNGYAVSVDYESTGTYDIAMRIEDASDGYKSYGEFRQTVNAGSGTVNGTLNVDAGAPAHSNYQIQTVITEVGGWWSQKLDNLNTSNVTVSSGGGDGLSAEYYDNMDFTNLMVTRVDPTVDFDWGSGSPDASMGADQFSVRWTGQIEPLYAETYTFKTRSDDGIRLWVNGQLIIDNWTNHAPTYNTGTISLSADNKYDIKLEYYENGGGAVSELYWSSNSQAEQIIPQSQLFSSSGAKSGEILADIKDDVSNKINIYPNPADDKVTITIPDGEYDIVINNLQGATQDVLPNHTGITKLNVSDYSAGIYIVKINNGNKQIIKKLVIR